jgi:hypothetical protein
MCLQAELYALFGDTVLEFELGSLEPPGLGICALNMLFSCCSSLFSWLRGDELHVAVQTRGHPWGLLRLPA